MNILIYFLLGIIFYNYILPILNTTTDVIIKLLNLIIKFCDNKMNKEVKKKEIGFRKGED